MASSVDGSFKARVDKIFGSLPSSSTVGAGWSLTDEEVEKREWRREKGGEPNRDDQTPCSSSFDGFFRKNRRKNSRRTSKELLQDPNDDDEQPADEDEWEIRSSIGLDSTLDNEEEEDEYDKLAEGRENAGDRLYMRDVTHHGPYLNSHNVLPSSIHVAPRDPRANHYAAQIRLKEDQVAAVGKLDSHQTCDKSTSGTEEDPRIIPSEDSVIPKSILKRKDNATVKLSKRVRFDPACKDACEEASEGNHGSSTASGNDSLLAENVTRVPDYLVNPSKYLRYNFDSTSNVDEESNSHALMNFLLKPSTSDIDKEPNIQTCMDFLLQPTKRPKSIMLEHKLDDASVDTPKSVMFIPRKKASEAKAVICSSEVTQNHGNGSKRYSSQASFDLGIAAGEVQQNEVGLMGEDEPETESAGISAGFKKPSRHYRNKSSEEDTVS